MNSPTNEPAKNPANEPANPLNPAANPAQKTAPTKGPADERYTLTLSCPERAGIVHAVTTYLVANTADIKQHQQFDDPISGRLFLRTTFSLPYGGADLEQLRARFARVATDFDMSWKLNAASTQKNVLIMVSKLGHCLNDLLFRWKSGALDCNLVAVVSNHEEFRTKVEAEGLPFIHIPVTAERKAEAETELRDVVHQYDVDLIVLARYMQVLSDSVADEFMGRVINIHHSFLPSFKGAKPYHQAYARGVKAVGATAHYVTAELDEGPIIEQEIARIDHNQTPDDLVTIGRDAECLALSRAIQWHCQDRVLLNGNRTVVFK